MTGWRIGMAVGIAEALRALGVVKTNLDSGAFTAVQRAGSSRSTRRRISWTSSAPCISATRRRDRDLNGLAGRSSLRSGRSTCGSRRRRNGRPRSSPTSSRRGGVFVAPGTGYGDAGEGYVRISLTVSDDLLAEAMDRIARAIGG
jgi:LL-diaminopimelate aminotransferase